MSKNSLSAVNAIRARLQKAANACIAGGYDTDEANAVSTALNLAQCLFLITPDENSKFIKIRNKQKTSTFKLKRLKETPPSIPNIGFTDTNRFVGYSLLYLLGIDVIRVLDVRNSTIKEEVSFSEDCCQNLIKAIQIFEVLTPEQILDITRAI